MSEFVDIRNACALCDTTEIHRIYEKHGNEVFNWSSKDSPGIIFDCVFFDYKKSFDYLISLINTSNNRATLKTKKRKSVLLFVVFHDKWYYFNKIIDNFDLSENGDDWQQRYWKPKMRSIEDSFTCFGKIFAKCDEQRILKFLKTFKRGVYKLDFTHLKKVVDNAPYFLNVLCFTFKIDVRPNLIIDEHFHIVKQKLDVRVANHLLMYGVRLNFLENFDFDTENDFKLLLEKWKTYFSQENRGLLSLKLLTIRSLNRPTRSAKLSNKIVEIPDYYPPMLFSIRSAKDELEKYERTTINFPNAKRQLR